MPYIPFEKMNKLREGSKNGDALAKKILLAQLRGEDYESDLEEYFKPKAEPTPVPTKIITEEQKVETVKEPTPASVVSPRLAKWLEYNGISESDPDYKEALEEYYFEFPEERPTSEKKTEEKVEEPVEEAKEEIDLTKDIGEAIVNLINLCDETSTKVLMNEEVDDAAKKGASTMLQEIKNALFDAGDKIKKIKKSLCKNDEEALE